MLRNLNEKYINVSWQPNVDDYRRAIAADQLEINYARILEGKVCLITGASDGMGYTMAELYAQHGARLIITARRKEKLEAAAQQIREKVPDADILSVAVDVMDVEGCKKLFEMIMEKYGRLDTLVNNAGVGDFYRAETTPDDTLDYMIDMNLKAPARYCREALNIMLPQGYGHIVNVSSVNGVRPLCGQSYSAAKGGLNTLTKGIAIRCVGTGVNCNALCPGFTITPLSLRQESSENAPADLDQSQILRSRSVRNVPTYPIDQANLALFLGSDMARAINGQVIVCDNGQYL